MGEHPRRGRGGGGLGGHRAGGGVGKGRENAISFPERIPQRPLCRLQKGNFGGVGEGKVVVGGWEGGFTIGSSSKGLI